MTAPRYPSCVVEKVARAIRPKLFELYPNGNSKAHQEARNMARASLSAMQPMVEGLREARTFIDARAPSDRSWGDAADTCDILAKLDTLLSQYEMKEEG